MRHLSPDVLTQTMMPYLMGMVMPPAPCQQPSVVCHDDLKGEHILIASAGDAITGIIDWSDLSLADPATDFAGLIIWLGGSFVATVLRQYTLESDGQILARARFLARANALYLLGERLAGESDAPLDLLRTQLRWAFVEGTG